jgi:hypothetical protein
LVSGTLGHGRSPGGARLGLEATEPCPKGDRLLSIPLRRIGLRKSVRHSCQFIFSRGVPARGEPPATSLRIRWRIGVCSDFPRGGSVHPGNRCRFFLLQSVRERESGDRGDVRPRVTAPKDCEDDCGVGNDNKNIRIFLDRSFDNSTERTPAANEIEMGRLRMRAGRANRAERSHKSRDSSVLAGSGDCQDDPERASNLRDEPGAPNEANRLRKTKPALPHPLVTRMIRNMRPRE